MSSARSAPSRFVFIRELGRGGMGAVDLVWDEVRQEEVARKRCRVAGGIAGGSEQKDALARLKREFRATAELRHPSIVPVYELGEDGEGLYFTMQAVEGVDLFQWCRGRSHAEAAGLGVADTVPGATAPTLDDRSDPAAPASGFCLDRLAALLPSLLEGLAYLHARGLVHRDLKPSNVLVDHQAHARIVDFGVLAELAAPHGEAAGTPAYMAPEQILGAGPTTEMDRYALGVTLFELVAGAPPFAAPSARDLFDCHLHVPAPRLSQRVRDVPPVLDEAVARLLAKEPSQRPTLADLAASVLPCLGADAPVLEVATPPSGDLVGRELLQRRLADWLDRSAAFSGLVLDGPSGVGKTALARWTADRADAAGWALLRGRARPTELLPFNAIDGAIDDLARTLGELDDDDVDARGARARAAIAFPALATPGADGLGNDVERSVSFDSVTRLVTSLANRFQGVLVVVDDLQWADADSLSYLEALGTAAPDRVKWLATCRDDLPSRDPLTWIDRQRSAQRIAVPPLDAASLSVISMAAAGHALDPETARRIAEGCAGRAYLAEVAGRIACDHGLASADLPGALAERLAALGPGPSDVLCALAAAEGWLSVGDLADALGQSLGAVDDAARTLAGLAVVRRTGHLGRTEQLDLYHDVARVAAIDVIGDQGVQRGHLALAALLSSRPSADPLRLVRHLASAGQVADAAQRAEVEARRAESRRAYALAAQLYALAADGMPDRAAELGRARAIALIRGGLYADAVAQLDRIDRLGVSDAGQRAGLVFDRAYALLMGDEVHAGRRALDESLALRGTRKLAGPGLRVIRDAVRLLRGPVRPARSRSSDADAPGERQRREREAEIALLLTWEDPIAGMSWALRCRALADRAGRPERGALADYVLAFVMVATGGRAGDSKVAQRYLDVARRRAAPIRDQPFVVALDGAVEALMDFRRGRFAAAADAFAQIADGLEQAGHARTHTHLLVLSNTCGTLMSGELPRDLVPALAHFVAACPPSRGAMEAHVLVVEIALAIFRGDRTEYARARERLRERRDQFGAPQFSHMVGEVIGSYGEIFWGDPVGARRANAQTLREARMFRPYKTYFAGAFAAMCALVEVAAMRAGDARASRRRIARWARIARRAPPMFTPGALRAEAYAADCAGRPDRAVAILQEAEMLADRYDLRVSRAIARYQRGLRLGGDEGATLADAAREEIAAVGASPHLLDEDRLGS